MKNSPESTKSCLKLDTPEGRAEYDRLLRSFRQEEEQANKENLLFSNHTIGVLRRVPCHKT
jgi:hypothetical protein